MNRDTAIAVASLLGEISAEQNTSKRFVYMSGSAHPPFLPRYLSTKKEAEAAISALDNVELVSLRAGFIESARDRGWSVPLKHVVNVNHVLSSALLNAIPNCQAKSVLQNFYTDSSVNVDDVAGAALYSCFGADLGNGDALGNADIEGLNRRLKADGYRVELREVLRVKEEEFEGDAEEN